MAYIYKIENTINHKIYIGQTINPSKRFTQHKTMAKKLRANPSLSKTERRFNMPIVKAIAKYGIENFIFEILIECDDSLVDEAEIYFIKKFNSFKQGYNATGGGQLYKKRLEIPLSEQKSICYDYNQGISLRQLAKSYHRGQETIKRVLLINNVSIREFNSSTDKMFFKPEQWDTVVEKYLELKNINRVAEFFNCSSDNVRTVLYKTNTPIKKHRAVLQIDPITNQVINCFDNQTIAGKYITGIVGGSFKSAANHIGECCNNKRKTCKGYMWKFEE